MASCDLRIFAREQYAPEDTPLEEVLPDDSGYAVVDEFDNWCIREVAPNAGGLHIRWGEEYIPLEQSDRLGGWVWPARTGKKYDKLKSSRQTSGLLRIYRTDGRGRFSELSPALYVLAGSLLIHHYPLLLDRLGQLAVAERGAIVAPVEGPLPAGGSAEGAWIHSPSLRHAVRILEAHDVFEKSWPLILANPAVSLKRQPRSARVGTGRAERAASGVRQIARNPGRNHLQVSVLEEDHDTPENRFLAFALEQLGIEAHALAQLLKNEERALRSATTSPPQSAANALMLWRQGRATAAGAAHELHKMADRLQVVATWAQARRRHTILRALAPQKPLQPSLKLTRSPGYGAVYGVFRKVLGNDERTARYDDLSRGLMERTVRPTQELYEIWMVLETYQLLVDRFGFRPADGGPLAHLEMQAGRLMLKRSQRFDLELQPTNDPTVTYRVYLTYEPPVDYVACNPGKRCWVHTANGNCEDLELPCYEPTAKRNERGPDLVLETDDGRARMRFALDAKYRRYDEMRVRNKEAIKFGYTLQWECDTLGHAKQKYRDGYGYKAAWIIHSDPNYTFFGGDKFQTPPRREAKAGLSLYPGHTYGAIYAVPFETANLETLLRCLLMYHAGWYDICWTCRKRLTPKPGKGLTGMYYQCEDGHDFWVKSNCTRSKDHLLIKMGERSFHQVKRGNVWNCNCPQCGDQLPSEGSSVVSRPDWW